MSLHLNDTAVSTDKITSDQERRSPPRNRPPTGLLFHIGAGALLVVVMVFIAFYVIDM